MGDHPSRPPVPRWLERLPGSSAGHLRTEPVRLAPGGVWRAAVSPRRWWALTPPFHPYRPAPPETRRQAVCSLFHFPSAFTAWGFPSALPFGVRTFLGPPARPAATRPARDSVARGRRNHRGGAMVQDGTMPRSRLLLALVALLAGAALAACGGTAPAAEPEAPPSDLGAPPAETGGVRRDERIRRDRQRRAGDHLGRARASSELRAEAAADRARDRGRPSGGRPGELLRHAGERERRGRRAPAPTRRSSIRPS